ncbi:hypothetical protein [Pseudoalteromonas arctica]|uniref:hypothetical protein n=1 Tax=Pseudoalteromonas arctica TaxID=394751 RepID=UPI001B7D6B9F|nr:hypothetical protein [Pseudoalteromonas arctica]
MRLVKRNRRYGVMARMAVLNESYGFKYIKDVEIVGEHQLIEMQCSLKSEVR